MKLSKTSSNKRCINNNNTGTTAASTITISTPVSIVPATNQTRIQPTLALAATIDTYNSNRSSYEEIRAAVQAANIDQNTSLTPIVAREATITTPDNQHQHHHHHPHHKAPRRKSLLNFKSFDFHLKTFYTGLRHPSQTQLAGESNNISVDDDILGSQTSRMELGRSRQYQTFTRLPPYLKIKSPSNEEAENLLIDYSQSPYSTRRNSNVHEDHQSCIQLIVQQHDEKERHLNQQQGGTTATTRPVSHSPTSTSSGVFLLLPSLSTCDQLKGRRTMRRSSTSDIMMNEKEKRTHRPSTSELLRKARERQMGQNVGLNRMGRSVSHTGLPRGGVCAGFGYRPDTMIGGRRTSMAF